MLQSDGCRAPVRVLVQRGRRILLFGMLLLILTTTPLWSQSADFAIGWFRINGGGGASQGANYAIRGTAGQLVTGTATGGNYQLAPGFVAPSEDGPQPGGQTLYVPNLNANQ